MSKKCGIGEPEALKYDLQGEYSRRIDEVNRLVCHIEKEQHLMKSQKED